MLKQCQQPIDNLHILAVDLFVRIMSGVLEGGGQSARADVMLGGHVS